MIAANNTNNFKKISKAMGLLFITAMIVSHSHSQQQTQLHTDSIRWRQSQDSIRNLTEQDHQDMMDQLHITSIRPGANGNDPRVHNAANYDEAKANPYPNLPDALTLKNGKKVTTAKMWWKQRRPEIVEDFDREIYGRVPANTPKVKWEVVKDTMEMNGNVQVHTKKLIGHVDNSSYPAISVNIDLTLSTPANTKGPVPVIMEFGFVFPPGFRFPTPSRDTTKPHLLPCMATTGSCKRMGLCHSCSRQCSGRQWCRT